MKLTWQGIIFLLFFLGTAGCSNDYLAKSSGGLSDNMNQNEFARLQPSISHRTRSEAFLRTESMDKRHLDGQNFCVDDVYLQSSLKEMSNAHLGIANSNSSKKPESSKVGIDDLVDFVRGRHSAFSGTVGPLHLNLSCEASLATKGTRLERLFYAHGVSDNSATFTSCRANTPFCSRTVIDGPQTGRRMEEVLMAYLPYVPDFPKLEFISRISQAYDLEPGRSGFTPWKSTDVEPCPQSIPSSSTTNYDCYLLRNEILDNIITTILYLDTEAYRFASMETRMRTGQYIGCRDLSKISAFYTSASNEIEVNHQTGVWLARVASACHPDKVE